ncbi:MAG: hypothetical protein R3A13_07050 [Bdellovibrionota bacterium]
MTLFALDETVTILENLSSGLVQNITETSAIFSLSYFINRFCIVVFKGEFTVFSFFLRKINQGGQGLSTPRPPLVLEGISNQRSWLN